MGLVRAEASTAPILVDTSFLVSLYDRREAGHRRCVEGLARVRQPLVTCEAVITEAMYHVRRMQGAAQAILANLHEGRLEIRLSVVRAAARVSELMKKYADTPCDFADACLIQMADELNTGDILTLDSDFRHYRWRRNRKFNLLIPLD